MGILELGIDYRLDWVLNNEGEVFCRLTFLPTRFSCDGVLGDYLVNADIKNIREVVIPEGVLVISDNAFADCHVLQNVVLPKSLIKIGNHAFDHCLHLSDIVLPDGLKEIGDEAFSNCISLRKLVIPDSVRELGKMAFYSSGLIDVSIGNGVREIENHTFANCSYLKRVKFQENLELSAIRDSAFACCPLLESINLPNSVEILDSYAFGYCSGLENIRLPDNLQKIGTRAFGDCVNLREIEIPSGVTVLPARVFENDRELTNVRFSNGLQKINNCAFNYCRKLEHIEFPDSLEYINNDSFANTAITSIDIPSSVIGVESSAFDDSLLEQINFINPSRDLVISPYTYNGQGLLEDLAYIYFSKNNNNVYMSSNRIEGYESSCYLKKLVGYTSPLITYNYRNNYVTVNKLKDAGKIRYIPQDYILNLFPPEEMENFFVNKNDIRYRGLVYNLKFNDLDGDDREIACTALFKIYYALGGFSANQGESEIAYNYVLDYVAIDELRELMPISSRWKNLNVKPDPQNISDNLHNRFSAINIRKSFNPIFAKFFMKYYAENRDFMKFQLKDSYGQLLTPHDYLCSAHNNFDNILKLYPNRSVSTNEERALLSPLFVAEHCSKVVYDKVLEGNENLAELVGNYGYTQEQFEKMQKVFEVAKLIKNEAKISADIPSESDPIRYRVLHKDDPLGFVLGDVTNCCQRYGADAESCVDDGYRNVNSGFLVFEERRGEDNKECRILGQAYVWYDYITQTVCYDNIEIPKVILHELRIGDKKKGDISYHNFLMAIVKSACSIVMSMNKRGILVKRVTTGKGYNDIKLEIERLFGSPISGKLPKNRGYVGYSDAKDAQYVLFDSDARLKLYKSYMQKINAKQAEMAL